jgi:hypothetical protein
MHDAVPRSRCRSPLEQMKGIIIANNQSVFYHWCDAEFIKLCMSKLSVENNLVCACVLVRYE